MFVGYNSLVDQVVIYLNPLISLSQLVTCLNREVIAHMVIYWLVSISALLLVGGSCCDCCVLPAGCSAPRSSRNTKTSSQQQQQQQSSSRSNKQQPRQQNGKTKTAPVSPSKNTAIARGELVVQTDRG